MKPDRSALRSGTVPGWYRWALLCLFALFVGFAQAGEGVQVQETRIQYLNDGTEAGWYLNASFRLEPAQRLEDAVNRGLSLVFVSEVEVSRPRWYWFDEKTVSLSQVYRLSYNALTQQYRVSTGSLSQRFDTLPEAMAMIGRVSRLRLAGRGELKNGEQYEVAVRLRLDTTQLPKPFQVNAMTNREWTLASDWKRFTFSAIAEPTP